MRAFLTIAGINPESGGPSRCVPSLAEGLARQGVNVELLTLCSDREALNGRQSRGYSICGYECRGTVIDNIRAVGELRRELRRRSIDSAGQAIIHDNGVWLNINHAAASVARSTRTPYIVSTHGMLSPWAMNHKALKKKIAWQLYLKRDIQTACLIHATSGQEADWIFACGLNKPVAVVPNGVDVPPWRERNDAAKDRRTILFLSRIYPVKGLFNLINAWQLIRAAGWRIVVAGPDEAGHRKEVMAAVEAAGMQDSFEFTGPVGDSEKWDLYFDADLFVLPSFTENFGIVVAEALACGVPVITTTGTPWQELLTHKCGWWVDIGVQPLADALAEAIALSDFERREMGIRGRKLIESAYGWDRIAAEMRSVYEWVLRGGTPPSCVRGN